MGAEGQWADSTFPLVLTPTQKKPGAPGCCANQRSDASCASVASRSRLVSLRAAARAASSAACCSAAASPPSPELCSVPRVLEDGLSSKLSRSALDATGTPGATGPSATIASSCAAAAMVVVGAGAGVLVVQQRRMHSVFTQAQSGAEWAEVAVLVACASVCCFAQH
jgi:hypothetical protein